MLRNLLFTLVVLVAAGAYAVHVGLYDVSAAKAPSDWEEWLLGKVRERSVEKRAAGLVVPALGSDAQKLAGFRVFRTHCVTCHGAPGVGPDDFAMGLYPMPPALGNDEVQKEGDAELFWIVQHGLKHTGMPGFGMVLSEEELWSTVAFLRHLPGLDASRFQALAEEALAAEAPPAVPPSAVEGPIPGAAPSP